MYTITTRHVKKYIKTFSDDVLDLIYPPCCILCDEILPPFKDYYLCSDCVDFFQGLEPPFCSCGLSRSLCAKNCENIFIKNSAPFLYQEMVQELTMRFKYAKKAFIGKGMAQLMIKHLPAETWDTDLIVPVPIHKNRLRKRGFNQAEILTGWLAEYLDLNYEPKLLIRQKDTKPLSGFSPMGRINTLKDAFAVKKKPVGKKVLLIDDIYTTGATLNVLAKILYENGACSVSCATFSVVQQMKS